MADRRNAGLCGKARQTHHKSRHAREIADSWIEDYEDGPVMEAAATRVIPVRHGTARLAALTVSQHETATSQSAQLKLPFDIEPSGGKTKPTRLTETTPDVAWKPTRLRQMPDDAQAADTRENKGSEPIHGVASMREPEEFTMRRFLLGCLMGGAAAAAILFAFQMIAG